MIVHITKGLELEATLRALLSIKMTSDLEFLSFESMTGGENIIIIEYTSIIIILLCEFNVASYKASVY